MSSENLYEILGVSETAPKDEIKKRYRKLVHVYHPDKHSSGISDVAKKQAEEKFKQISSAWATLGDDAKRAKYNESLRRMKEDSERQRRNEEERRRRRDEAAARVAEDARRREEERKRRAEAEKLAREAEARRTAERYAKEREAAVKAATQNTARQTHKPSATVSAPHPPSTSVSRSPISSPSATKPNRTRVSVQSNFGTRKHPNHSMAMAVLFGLALVFVVLYFVRENKEAQRIVELEKFLTKHNASSEAEWLQRVYREDTISSVIHLKTDKSKAFIKDLPVLHEGVIAKGFDYSNLTDDEKMYTVEACRIYGRFGQPDNFNFSGNFCRLASKIDKKDQKVCMVRIDDSARQYNKQLRNIAGSYIGTYAGNYERERSNYSMLKIEWRFFKEKYIEGKSLVWRIKCTPQDVLDD